MDHEHSTVKEVIDPVCGMSIVAEDAAGSVEYGGTTYYFCNPSCVEKFQANPEQFVGPALHHDPVCGMDIAVEDAAGSVDYDRTTYYFCNPSCLEKFKNNPKRYLDPQPLPTAGNTAVEYTCPMDPEVHQMGPGACPKCGMALEPATSRHRKSGRSTRVPCIRRSCARSPVPAPSAAWLSSRARLSLKK